MAGNFCGSGLIPAMFSYNSWTELRLSGDLVKRQWAYLVFYEFLNRIKHIISPSVFKDNDLSLSNQAIIDESAYISMGYQGYICIKHVHVVCFDSCWSLVLNKNISDMSLSMECSKVKYMKHRILCMLSKYQVGMGYLNLIVWLGG